MTKKKSSKNPSSPTPKPAGRGSAKPSSDSPASKSSKSKAADKAAPTAGPSGNPATMTMPQVAPKPRRTRSTAVKPSAVTIIQPTSSQPPAPVPAKVTPVSPPPPGAPGAPGAETPERDQPALTEAQLKRVKTDLTRKDLTHYRRLLLEKRAEIVGDVTSMEVDARNNSGGNLSSMPMHMADIGSDNYEQEFTLGLVESERKLLREIDEALVRIQKGYYGVCVETGRPINRDRLDAKPWAKYCIEVARDRERRGEK